MIPKASIVASHFSYFPINNNPKATPNNFEIAILSILSGRSDNVIIIAFKISSWHLPMKIKPKLTDANTLTSKSKFVSTTKGSNNSSKSYLAEPA